MSTKGKTRAERIRTHVNWPDEQRGPWRVGLTYVRQSDGPLLLVGVEMRCYEDAGFDELGGREVPMVRPTGSAFRPVTAQEIRLPLRQLEALGRQKLADDLAKLRDWGALDAETVERYRDRVEHHGAPDLLDVADIYHQAWLDGWSGPQAVAEHFGYSASTARNWIKRARDAGYLHKTTARQANGALTAKAKRELAKREKESD